MQRFTIFYWTVRNAIHSSIHTLKLQYFQFCIKFYVTSFDVFLPELALSELQSSPWTHHVSMPPSWLQALISHNKQSLGAEFEEAGFSLSAICYFFPPDVLCLWEKCWFLTSNSIIVFYRPGSLFLREDDLCLSVSRQLQAQHARPAADCSLTS